MLTSFVKSTTARLSAQVCLACLNLVKHSALWIKFSLTRWPRKRRVDDCAADPYACSGANAVVFYKNTRTAMVLRPIRHSSMTEQEKHKSNERRKEKETGQMKNIHHNGKARSRQRVHVTSGSEEQRHWGDHPETKETLGGGGGGIFTSLSNPPPTHPY